ncbi:MAG: hypothetical protein P8Z31_00140 [Gammaproteobacteria bacterium]
MDKRLEAFLDLSVVLTGFDHLQLMGTGVAPEYLETLDRVVSSGISDALLEASAGISSEEDLHAALSARILDDPVLGPLARNVIVLWYSGTWSPLPQEWWGDTPRSSHDVGHTVSAAAYLAGLQWPVASAHPPGGLPPGFASWASPPPVGEEI